MVKSSKTAIGPTPLDQPPLIRACVAYRHAITCIKNLKTDNSFLNAKFLREI